jgi:hypothetical protein
MNAAEQLKVWLQEIPVDPVLIDKVDPLLKLLPAGYSIEDDDWDVIDWNTRGLARKRTSLLRFSKITHTELRNMGKVWVLDGRLKQAAGVSTAKFKIGTFMALSRVLGARPLITIKTDDFYNAEKLLKDQSSGGYAFRQAGYLESASSWLGTSLGISLDYHNRLVNPVVHGRYGTDEGKANKLVPDSVFRDLIAARHREDLIAKDAFFLNVMAIQMATGFRISELMSLPADCLLREGGHLHILHYPAKGGLPIPRPIHPSMRDVVEDAVTNLTEITAEARAVAEQMRTESRLDWPAIYADDNALRYFVAKWAHEWTGDPNHLMINPNGAWSNRDQCFFDVIGELAAAGENKSQAARNLQMTRNTFNHLLDSQKAARRGELPVIANSKKKGQKRTSWDTDVRVVSFLSLEKHTSVSIISTNRELIYDILDEAQKTQLAGNVYPAPDYNRELEERFRFEMRPLLKNKQGKPIIYPYEALLITQKYALSEHRGTKTDEFSVVDDRQYAFWLGGTARSRGTGNHEDTVFARLEIIDPRNDDFAKFVSHDVRTWLNTIYQNGGLTEDQIALIFNRKNKQQNAVYDQTSNKVRSERMKQAIRDKIAVGTTTDTYTALADFSRDDAEDYLAAVVRMVNPMPHGVCMLDWSATPCPHNLSCFSCETEVPGPCEHLNVDPRNREHVQEMERIAKEADYMVDAIEAQGIEESPQIDHFKRVRTNVNVLLNRIPAVEVE